MLGFATVDLSIRDHSLTVWLTSVEMDTRVAHTNAVVFNLAEDAVSRRAWSMACDRYVILTDRTPRDHGAFAQWGIAPCDLAMLAKQATAAQEAVMAAFVSQAARPGKAALMEPAMPLIPQLLEQAALEAESPQQLTLAVANQVAHIWTAWLAAERERVKRWSYMPGGSRGESPAVLPAEFVQQNAVQPVRAWMP
jgi:hypothetical protein